MCSELKVDKVAAKLQLAVCQPGRQSVNHSISHSVSQLITTHFFKAGCCFSFLSLHVLFLCFSFFMFLNSAATSTRRGLAPTVILGLLGVAAASWLAEQLDSSPWSLEYVFSFWLAALVLWPIDGSIRFIRAIRRIHNP